MLKPFVDRRPRKIFYTFKPLRVYFPGLLT